MAAAPDCDLPQRGCCYQVKSSRKLVVAVVCIAMFTDSLLLTLVDPILPKMLLRIEIKARGLSPLDTGNVSRAKRKALLPDSLNLQIWPNDSSDPRERNTNSNIFDPRVIPLTTTHILWTVQGISEKTSSTNVSNTVFIDTGISAKNTNTGVNTDYMELKNITDTIDNLTLVLAASASKDLNSGGKFGYLVAAKGAAQFICNPFVGHIITRFGYRGPMLIGSFLLAGSTLAFAYSISYWMLMVCRLFQGLASSLTAVTSLGLAADTFRDDTERGKVVGYAFGGLSLGIIAGPLYGSLLYDFVSPEFPFQLLSGIIFVSMAVQLFSYKRRKTEKKESPAAIFHLIKDPYILIVAANIFLLNLDTSLVLAFLPLELMRLADPPTWQLGIVVLPTSVGYLLAGVICPRIIHVVPRWVQGITGMVISAGTLISLAFSFTFIHMIIVTTFLGLAIGMISTSMQPIFAYIVDIRHNDVYGNVYAISDMAVCLAMFIGPLVGGPVLYAFNFQSLLFGAAVLDLLCAPLCIFLRNPTPKDKDEHFESKENYKLKGLFSIYKDEYKPLLTDADNNQIKYTECDKMEYNIDTMSYYVKD